MRKVSVIARETSSLLIVGNSPETRQVAMRKLVGLTSDANFTDVSQLLNSLHRGNPLEAVNAKAASLGLRFEEA